jgi:poly-gamma-glutamate capsule biosynthesis protein CapA/YwtB (metallophosphatase superfamily)
MTTGQAAIAAAFGVVLLGAYCARERWWYPPVDVPAPVEIRRPAGAEPTLLFLGDTAPTDAATETLRARGWDWPFSATADVVRAADLAVANLEAAVAGADVPFSVWKRYRYRVEPEAMAALARGGIDVVGLANNHAMDCGRAGLAATLGSVGLPSFGAGTDEAAARRGLLVHLGGARVALLAYLEPTWTDAVWSRAFARAGRPGVARLSPRAVLEDVARVRRQADVVIAFVHWGENYQDVTASQRFFARALADAGVDLIVGHHPHVAQPLGMVGRTLCAYSIGNYAFGTPGHASLFVGLMLRATLRAKRLARVELLPLDVQNRRVRFRPRPLSGEAARRALEPIARVSREQGVPLRIDGDRAVADLR